MFHFSAVNIQRLNFFALQATGTVSISRARINPQTSKLVHHGLADWLSTLSVSARLFSHSYIQAHIFFHAAAVVTFVALLLSLSQHAAVTLFASLTSFLAAFLTLIAFACDIALFAYLKQQAGKLPGVVAHTTPGAGKPLS